MHPNCRLIPALLVKISGHETQPGSSHRTWATAGFEQSLPSPYFACATRRGRWGPRTPCDCNHARIEEKESGFLNRPNFYYVSLAR